MYLIIFHLYRYSLVVGNWFVYLFIKKYILPDSQKFTYVLHIYIYIKVVADNILLYLRRKIVIIFFCALDNSLAESIYVQNDNHNIKTCLVSRSSQRQKGDAVDGIAAASSGVGQGNRFRYKFILALMYGIRLSILSSFAYAYKWIRKKVNSLLSTDYFKILWSGNILSRNYQFSLCGAIYLRYISTKYTSILVNKKIPLILRFWRV